jgi:hypothetical protein
MEELIMPLAKKALPITYSYAYEGCVSTMRWDTIDPVLRFVGSEVDRGFGSALQYSLVTLQPLKVETKVVVA